MPQRYEGDLKGGRLHCDRWPLMFPINGVGAIRLKGEVDVGKLQSAIARLWRRHALLGVRMVVDDQGTAWYETENVSENPVRVIDAAGTEDWLRIVGQECMTSFPVRTGPLLQFALVRSVGHSHLVSTAHHAICDGVSHMFLMRDVLYQLADPDRDIEVLPPPPPINATTVRSPPRAGLVERWLVGLMNRRWKRQKISFDEADRERLQEAYWRKNGEPVVLAWDLPPSRTATLVARCRKERVVVNSALWTAFLGAQYDVQGDAPFRRRVGMPVNTRGKLTVPVGEVIGAYASPVIAELRHDPLAGFWDAARKIQRMIHQALKKTDLFSLLKLQALDPGLLESIYFAKYGLITSRVSHRVLSAMGMDRVRYGFTMSYLDGGSLPTEYGPLSIEALYGFVYTDFNEKVVAVTKVGGRMSFSLVCNAEAVGAETAGRIRDAAMARLEEAAGLN